MDITVDLIVTKTKKANFSKYNKLVVNTFECQINSIAIIDSSDTKTELLLKLTAPVKTSKVFKSLLNNCEEIVFKAEKNSDNYKIEKIIFVV